MVNTMAKKTLEQLFAETNQVSAEVGKRANAHTDRKTAEVQTTVALVGKRVNAHTDKKATEVQDTIAKTGKRVTDHVTTEHNTTRQHVTAEHEETRDIIREEAERTRRIVGDYADFPEIVIGLILGIIAAVAMWLCEKDVVVKPTAMDAAGNVTAYGTDVFMVAVLAIVLGAFVAFTTCWIIHAIRRH